MGIIKIYKPLTSMRMGKMVFLLCWLSYFTTYIGRLNYSAAMAGMIESGEFSRAALGYVGTAFFMMYGAGQFISGFMGDRLSPFIMLGAGIFASAAMNLGMAYCSSVAGLCLIWGLNGLAQSVIWSPIMRIFSQVMPESLRYKSCIHINTTMAAGTISAYGISAFLLGLGHWKTVFVAAFWILFLMGCVWTAFFYRKRREFETVKIEEVQGKDRCRGFSFRWFCVTGLLILLIPSAVHGMLKDGITGWLPALLVEDFGLQAGQSMQAVMILPALNLAGTYMACYLNQTICRNEVKTAAVLFGFSGLIFSALPLLETKPLGLVAGVGLATTAMVGVNTMLISILPLRFGGEGKASTVTGIFNSAAYIGCSLSMVLFGVLAETGGFAVLNMVWLLLALLATGCCVMYLCKKRGKRRPETAVKT